MWCEPRPLQPGGVPLWISGRLHDRTLDRMARFGDGWIPWGDFRKRHRGRHPRGSAPPSRRQGATRLGFGVRGTLVVAMDGDGRVDGERTAAPVPAMVDAGVTDFGLAGAFADEDDVAGEQLSTLVSAFAAATGRARSGRDRHLARSSCRDLTHRQVSNATLSAGNGRMKQSRRRMNDR